MSANPIEHLEIEAAQQRNHAHDTISELKDKVVAIRASLDLNTNARKHFLKDSLMLSAIGFLAGYVFAGPFTRE